MFSILISGKIGSGKSTTQELLHDELHARLTNELVLRVNFADQLKKKCAALAGVPVAQFYSEEGKNQLIPTLGKTGRQLLQEVGEHERQANVNVWVEAMLDDALHQCDEAQWPVDDVILVVGDCRHPNEITNMPPGVSIRLTGDPAGVRARSDFTAHISETALDDYGKFTLSIDTSRRPAREVVSDIVRALLDVDPVRFEELAESPFVDHAPMDE